MHQRLAAPEVNGALKIPASIMRAFIAQAQTFQPTIPHDLHNYIVAKYCEKRKFQAEGSDEVSYMYITPRTLLGIIRISQSHARLHFRDVIQQPDVDQALKLMDYSIRSLRKMKDEKKTQRRGGKYSNFPFLNLVFIFCL